MKSSVPDGTAIGVPELKFENIFGGKMPGFTSHYLFGQSALANMKEGSLKDAVRKYNFSYNLGMQGPDIFFFYMKTAVFPHKPGEIAHEKKTGKFLKNMAQIAAYHTDIDQRECAAAYMAGFLGHYALDMTCHPFVYARTAYDGITDNRYFGRHCSLETDIDAHYLMMERSMHPSEFSKRSVIDISSAEARVICPLLSKTYNKTYGLRCRVSERSVAGAIKSIQKMTDLLKDPRGIKRTLLRKAEDGVLGYNWMSGMIECEHGFYHKDPCNMQHDIWKNPWKKEISRTESFYDLRDNAFEIYGQMLSYPERIITEGADFSKDKDVPDSIEKSYSYLSGLQVP